VVRQHKLSLPLNPLNIPTFRVKGSHRMIVLNVRLCFHLLRMRHTVHVFHYVNFVVYGNNFCLAIPKVKIMEHELSVNVLI